MATLKICRKCKAEKPLTEFHRRRSTKDGLYSYCKPCAIKDAQIFASSPERKQAKREYDKARVERLKDKLRQQYRANYAQNREQRIASAAEWAARNRDRRRLISQTYKHRRRSVEREGISWRELRDWKAAQAKVCHWCNVKCARSYVVDHIQPLAKGGKHEAHNLAISCRSCNARKSARDPIEWAQMIGKLL